MTTASLKKKRRRSGNWIKHFYGPTMYCRKWAWRLGSQPWCPLGYCLKYLILPVSPAGSIFIGYWPHIFLMIIHNFHQLFQFCFSATLQHCISYNLEVVYGHELTLAKEMQYGLCVAPLGSFNTGTADSLFFSLPHWRTTCLWAWIQE